MYKDYIFKPKNKAKKSIPKLTLKILKILLYSFLFLSMLWGCSEMFVSKFNSYQVVDSSGVSVYKSGMFFEILFKWIGDSYKLHYGHIDKNHFYEYPYLSINSWAEAFQKTQSPFYGLFVYPTAWLLIEIMVGFGGPTNGAAVLISIFIMSMLVRLITITFTWKSQVNQEKMQLLQIKQNEIKSKYGNVKNDPMLKRKQQMEIMDLYKKNKVSPLSSMGSMLLSLPFLFALYITIKSTRVLKTAFIGQISLIEKPWSMITTGHFIYLTLLVVYLPLQIISVFLPTVLSLRNQENKTPEQKKARKKQFLMQGLFVFMFLFVAVSVAAGVAIYWIFSSALQIIQTLGFHYLKIWRSKKGQRIKAKDKIERQKNRDIDNKPLREVQADVKIHTNTNNKKNQNNKKTTNKKNKTFTL